MTAPPWPSNSAVIDVAVTVGTVRADARRRPRLLGIGDPANPVLLATDQIQGCAGWARHDCFGSRGCLAVLSQCHEGNRPPAVAPEKRNVAKAIVRIVGRQKAEAIVPDGLLRGSGTSAEMAQPVCYAPMHAVGTLDRVRLAPASLPLARCASLAIRGERPQDERKRGRGSVRRKPRRVHVAEEKQVFLPGGHDYEQPDGAVMREIGDDRGSRSGTARYGKRTAGSATSKSCPLGSAETNASAASHNGRYPEQPGASANAGLDQASADHVAGVRAVHAEQVPGSSGREVFSAIPIAGSSAPAMSRASACFSSGLGRCSTTGAETARSG